jgi:oxamate amidohydrolase
MTGVAVAAPHAAAVEAGRSVAAAGGNALDAALAAAAALTVVYPHQCSLGGDLIAMVRTADGRVRAVLSAGAAAMRQPAMTTMPTYGPLTVTVPGVVAGWAAIAGLGARLGWTDRLAPAIALARDGVPVSPGLARALRAEAARVAADPGLSALAARDPLVQPALAGTLAEVAADWTGFYRGSLADRLAAALSRFGSPLTAADLAAHRAEPAEPLTGRAFGAAWSAAPPPSQGATFLAVLGAPDLLSASWDARRARDALLGDPRTGPVDLDGLLLRGDRPAPGASPDGPRPTGDTVAVTAVDSDGTAVSLIQSVFHSFGAGLLDPGTGIVLHNRGSMFRLGDEHPGRLRPGSRPPHTLCPVIAVRDDVVLALGCQGGRSQPWILAQVAADALDGDDPAAVLARPRWIIDSAADGSGPAVVVEPGTPGMAGTVPGPHDGAGHVQLARLRGTVLEAAGDPRADGSGTVQLN